MSNEAEATFPSEDNLLGEEQENETPSESPTEKNEQSETSPSHQGEDKEEAESSDNTDDDNKKKTENFVPYERFKEVINDKNELRQRLEELENTVQQKIVPSNEDVKIPNWFQKLYGDDRESWQEYQADEKERFNALKQSIVQEQVESQKKYEESVKRWEGYSKDQMQALEDEGKSFDRNELMKVVLDYQPTDAQGNFDFKKAYQILELTKRAEHDPAKSEARKNLAASTTSDNKGESNPKDYMTPKDFRGKSIFDLIH